MVGLHRGDHGVRGPALERVHSRGPGLIAMAELRVAGGEIEHAPVVQPERDSPVLHRRDLGGRAVDEPGPGIVACPAEAIAGAEFEILAAACVGRKTSAPSRFTVRAA